MAQGLTYFANQGISSPPFSDGPTRTLGSLGSLVKQEDAWNAIGQGNEWLAKCYVIGGQETTEAIARAKEMLAEAEAGQDRIAEDFDQFLESIGIQPGEVELVSAQELRAQMQEEGVRPEDNIGSSMILQMREELRNRY